MKFNGIDPTSLHPAISIAEEIPPGMAKRQITTVAGTDGEIVSDVKVEKDEYIVYVNFASRNRGEAWALREKLAAWAGSSGRRTAELIPTHMPQRVYDAILSEVGKPKFSRRFATIDVTFMLPRPISRSAIPSTAYGGGRMEAMIGGSAPARPVIRQTIAEPRADLAWTMDGKTILTIRGELSAGQTVEMDVGHERLTIDGVNAMPRIDPQAAEWRPGYAPGVHRIASTDSGQMEMRWHDEWL